MIRPFVLLIAITSICIYSCKKSDSKSTPAPKPTSDFREKYKGTFNITRISSYHSSPPPPKPSTTSWDTSNYTVSIDYSIDDSVKYEGYNFMFPAVTFTHTNGNQTKYGMDDMGHLYLDPGMSTQNSGGFIGTDSISHNYDYTHTKYTRYESSIYGTRQK